ncbi:hypothetical protein BU24DRAFT_235760 [Aaosphaeria arxii CBS 175.79]|uniref:Transcription factor domain-containing protein n=1 Tax=Aaosphaeria arxii CBS 175.79 TaxID=1450172 RepID=A0A6A5XKL6_9PLEO|nr:uncharacterized protein BU24DRAFT_235760 [Aaosphaeria arxii CBS 175.79]KAF2013347.1 hypothetical protein BU24DRAFT_235760 [Aaosphaeria arxii CBS 175.79]
MEAPEDDAKVRQRSMPTVTPIQQDFLFVDASKSAKSSRQGRRNARSFVMQKARRERPWSTSKHAAKQRKSPETTSPVAVGTPDITNLRTPNTTTPSPTRTTLGPDYRSFESYRSFEPADGLSLLKQVRCSECQMLHSGPGRSLCRRCIVLNTPTLTDPDHSLFDPFGTISVNVNESVTELLDHFVARMAPTTIPLDFRNKSNLMRSDWFGTAMNNSGFMHSLLCTAALHMFVFGKGSFDTIHYHKAQAIAAVNAAISDPDPLLGISDANIGAVFNLLCVEESLPHLRQLDPGEEMPNQRQIHLDGLRRMVQLRGGLKAIHSNRILQAFILWHSTAHAIAAFDIPYLSSIDYISTSHFPPHPPGYRPRISDHLIEYCRAAQIQSTLTVHVESALILIADLNDGFGNPESPLDPLDIQNSSCVLECLLLDWLRSHEGRTTPLENALCVALLILTVRATEALQRRSDPHTLHTIASARLVKSLCATSREEWAPCPDLLLWILTIGAISSEGSMQYSWFSYQVSLACQEFGVGSVQILLDRLHLCGWVGYKLDTAVHHLWNNILHLRQTPSFDPINEVGPLQPHVSPPDWTNWHDYDDWLASSDNRTPTADPDKQQESGAGIHSFGHYIYYPTAQPVLQGIQWASYQAPSE